MTTLTNIFFGGENLKKEFNNLTIIKNKKMENNLEKYKNLIKLENLGFENVEAGDFYYYFDFDGYSYQIEDVYDTIEENINYAIILSGCCGEEVDSDYMICPNCLEHV